MTVTLPRKPVKSEIKNTRKLLIYSPPKRGKTTLLAGLPNGLTIDLEQGAAFLDMMKIEANNLEELIEVGKAIKAANDKEGKQIYDYIAIDTATKLEEFAWELALKNYKSTVIGRSFSGDAAQFKQLPKGAGYPYLWEAFDKLYSFFATLSPHLILTAHLKRTMITDETTGKEVEATDIELTGKLKTITCADMDGIGMLKRKGNQSILSFKVHEDDLLAGSRPVHLKDQEIVVCEYIDDKFVYHWDKIFLP